VLLPPPLIGGKFSPSRASARAVRCEKRPMRRKPDGLVGSVTFAPIFLKSGYSTISTACLVETQRYTSGSVPRSWPSDARARGRLVTQSNHPDGRLREPRRSAPRRSAAGTRSGGPRREPVGVEAASRSRLGGENTLICLHQGTASRARYSRFTLAKARRKGRSSPQTIGNSRNVGLMDGFRRPRP